MTKQSVVMVIWLSLVEDGVHLSKGELSDPLVDAEGTGVVEQDGSGGAVVTIS